MPRPVVALDADVLVPIVACDFLLTAFESGLYEPVVSTRVLEEVERTLLTDLPYLSPDAVRYRVAAMRDALLDQLVDAAAAEVPEAINPKDRHVVGAALVGQATMLTTNDSDLREQVADAVPSLRALSLDEFTADLWQRSPDDLSAVVDNLVAKRTSLPVTREAMLQALRSHMPTIVDHLERLVGS